VPRMEARRASLGDDLQQAQPALLIIVHPRIDFPLVELAGTDGARIVAIEQDAQKGYAVRGHQHANVLLNAPEQVLFDPLDDGDVVFTGDVSVALFLKELADLEIVMRADDRSSRDAGNNLD